MLQSKESLSEVKESKLVIMLTNNRAFTPRGTWINIGKKYCSMYSWGEEELQD
jgi:hypothetical protein